MVGGIAPVANNHLYQMLRLYGVHPPDMQDFLDYAVSLILLRKVGGGYIFIHRYLLEYFADLEVNEQKN